jgi:hypothetical protein
MKPSSFARSFWRASLCKILGSAALAAFFTLTQPAFAQTPFTAGDLVVSTYGVEGGYMNGTLQPTSIDGVPTPITLEEFTTNGTFVMSDNLSTTNSGSNLGVVGEYGSSSEANLQLSADGQYLLIAGYQANVSIAGLGSPGNLGYYNANPDGVDALAQSNAATIPRVIAEIGANGVANTSTVFNEIYNQNNPRSVWSANGSLFYVSGQGNGTTDEGIFTIKAGNNTVSGGSPAPTPISANTGLDTRIVAEYNGNLYYSVDVKGVATGIYEYAGIPTSVATATEIIPANNGLSGNSEVFYSPDAFYFANSTTLYVADTGKPKNKGLGDGGIQKWTLVGSNWVLDYTLTPSNFVQNYNDKTSSLTDGETGFESITGEVVNGTVDLFAVSYTIGDADEDGLYAISDNLTALTNPGNETFDELATAPGVGESSTGNLTAGGAVFKSVSFAPQLVPEPSTYALLLGLGAVGAAFWRRRRETQGA